MTEDKTKDGIPKFDGTPEKLPAYKERAIQYSMGVEYHKRYLCGPWLLQELTGVAKVITRTVTLRNPQWLSNPRGVYQLLQFLEEHIARPSLIEASKQVVKLFYNLQRARGETMTEWISRHAEALWEASAALRRVQKEYEGKKTVRTSVEPEAWQSWQSSAGGSERSGPFRDDGRLAEEDEDSSEGHWWHGNRQWHWEGSQGWWSQDSWRSAEYEPPETWDTSDEIFIPEFLAGFLLLHRCNLEPSEKSNILAAIKGEFSTTTVAKALREQWSDTALIRRDKQKAPTSLLAEEDEDAMLGEEEESPDLESLGHDAREAYYLEEEKAHEALEAIKMHKATLKEARWNQRQIRLGRNFYPTKPYSRKGDGKGKSKDGQLACFKCGGPHLQRECPQLQRSAKVAEEAAEIAFGACEMGCQEEFTGSACEKDELAYPAEEVLNQCMGIIDSGATSSLGSIDAMEAVVQQNLAQDGSTKVDVDLSQRPVFKFGNGMAKTCVSTATMAMDAGSKQGQMTIHVHDAPGQPILVSRKALRALGAVIDFAENKVIYRQVNGRAVVPLREAANGHLLMPLTGNLLDGHVLRRDEFLGLDAE